MCPVVFVCVNYGCFSAARSTDLKVARQCSVNGQILQILRYGVEVDMDIATKTTRQEVCGSHVEEKLHHLSAILLC